MRRIVLILTVAATLTATTVSAATTVGKTYDLLFRSGTLDDVAQTSRLVYGRDVTNGIKPEAADRDTGDVILSFAGGEPPQARLTFEKDGKHRNLGVFPASVGNPIIMYFVETVVRDMAETAGGSPFYIRNRVKEALIEPAEIGQGEAIYHGRAVPTVDVTMRPFRGDKNADRMMGFDGLTLTVRMSEEVPGWYLELGARAPGRDGGASVYSSALTFQDMGPAE